MSKSPITANAVLLAGFALVTAFLLAGTQLGTREQIARSERQAAEKALLEIIPEQSHDNDLLADSLPVPAQYWAQLGLAEGGDIHVARKDKRIVAVIVPAVAADGYSGDIRLIVGINMDGRIAGVRVLDHRETPGLGDKVDLKKSDWILGFNDKSLINPTPDAWKVKKDGGEFDQFTGATITPRAVVRQVKLALDYFNADRARILGHSTNQGTNQDGLEQSRDLSASDHAKSGDSNEDKQ